MGSMMSERPLSSVLPEPAQTGLGKDEQVRRMFDRIAGRYDLLNNWISMGFHKRWKRLACHRLQLKPGDRVLDVCTGTGDLIDSLLPLVGKGGMVEGLDFSENMLAVAKARYRNHPNVTLTQGDALRLPYPDAHFDGAIISFGLRNVTDIPGALREMQRVVKPGGWMVNLDTSPSPFLPGMQLYFSKIVPWLGGLLAKDGQAYRYLSESTRHFLTPRELKALFQNIGLLNVRCEPLMLGSVSLQSGHKPE